MTTPGMRIGRGDDRVIGAARARGKIWVSSNAPASPSITESSTTSTPMMALILQPANQPRRRRAGANHSKVRHSHGMMRGKDEELKAVIDMMISGPNRYPKNKSR